MVISGAYSRAPPVMLQSPWRPTRAAKIRRPEPCQRGRRYPARPGV